MEGDYPGSTYDPKQCQFWPSVLKANGYHTAQIGKWHTDGDTGNGRTGIIKLSGTDLPTLILQGIIFMTDRHVQRKDRRVEGYSTDNYTDWAIDYIEGENRGSDKPWYLWLCYGAIHGPPRQQNVTREIRRERKLISRRISLAPGQISHGILKKQALGRRGLMGKLTAERKN